jgi:hypothetical protein
VFHDLDPLGIVGRILGEGANEEVHGIASKETTSTDAAKAGGKPPGFT